MNNHYWMYRDSPQGLCREDYCKGIETFINFVFQIQRILVEVELDVYMWSVKTKSSTNDMLYDDTSSKNKDCEPLRSWLNNKLVIWGPK
jgi:hypothetical protein